MANEMLMKKISINNPEVLDILDRAIDMWKNDPEFEQSTIFGESPEKRDNYISDEYFQKIYDMGLKHNGFPRHTRMANFKIDSYRSKPGYSVDYITRYLSKWRELNTELQMALGTRRNALSAVYPPGGWIDWHNNANASSYNLIMTWSETGDGYWKHYNPYTKEIETIHDVPGWQAKATYFGSYKDGLENVVYHMASTDCWRMTLGYMFDRNHKEYWEEALEELEYDGS